MPQALQNIQKLNTEVIGLKREIRSLRSLFIGLAGKDQNGDYRPEFVKEILKAGEQKPTSAFKGARSFLTELRRA